MNDDDDDLSALDLVSLVRTARGRVVISKGVADEYDSLEEKARGRFARVMELWCDGRPLADNMFNGNEGRAPETNIMLMAFKGFKIRLYGYQQSVLKLKTFIVVDIDGAKKQNKADKNILKRAKHRINEISKGLKNA